jgi:chemotaxis protein histidine kinase CheA
MGATPAQVAPVAAQSTPQAAAPREAAAPAARPPAALPVAPQAVPQVAQAATAAVQPAVPAAVPPVAAQADTSRLRSQEEIAAEKRRSEVQQAADTKRAEELAKAAAAKEAAVEQSDRTARNTYQSSSKILDYLKKSPNFFGIFARPGVVPAIGGFIEQGLRTGNGTIDLPGFRDSITKLMPNVRQQDLDNLMLAASELAEIELNFSRLYFQGQGAVTENERKIVRAIPGSVSSSPRVLKARMELLRDRAQYDIDVADAFRDWQGKNVGRSYLDFERDSQLYKDIKKDFDNKAAKIYNGLPAIPTRERRAADQQGAVQQQSSQSSGVQPSVGFIRDPNTGVIRRKKPGE